MARNILLTSLSAAEDNLPVRYFSIQNEFGSDYCDALFDACPELCDKAGFCRQWVRGYLYEELKASAKLELLSVNEAVCIRMIPEDRIEESGAWIDSMTAMQKSIVEGEDDINLYISLNSDDAADTFVVINMLLLYGVPEPGAQTLALVLHTAQTFCYLFTGAVAWIVLQLVQRRQPSAN